MTDRFDRCYAPGPSLLAMRQFPVCVFTAEWIRPLKPVSAEDLEAAIEVVKAELKSLSAGFIENGYDLTNIGAFVMMRGGGCVLTFTPHPCEENQTITVKFSQLVPAAAHMRAKGSQTRPEQRLSKTPRRTLIQLF